MTSDRAPAGEGSLRGRRVLVIGAGAFQLDLIRAARRRGAFLLIADRDPAAPGMALADVPVHVDTRALDALVAAARRERVEAVVTAGSDVALPAVAAVATALGLAGPSPAAVARARDKLVAFAALRDQGFSMLPTLAVETEERARTCLAQVGGLPCVVKPRVGSGGRGVSIVSTIEALGPALQAARDVDPGSGSVLLQAYAAGAALGAEAAFSRGELVATFFLHDQMAPRFVSPVGHSWPAQLSREQHAQLVEDIGGWGRALGVTDGLVNLDLRLGPAGACLLELNPRPGGSSISALLSAGAGVDLGAAALACALGQSPRAFLEPNRGGAAACRLMIKPGWGRVRTCPDLEAWQRQPGVVLCEAAAAGSLPGRVNGWSLVGRCVTCAEDEGAALALAERIATEVASEMELEVHDD